MDKHHITCSIKAGSAFIGYARTCDLDTAMTWRHNGDPDVGNWALKGKHSFLLNSNACYQSQVIRQNNGYSRNKF